MTIVGVTCSHAETAQEVSMNGLCCMDHYYIFEWNRQAFALSEAGRVAEGAEKTASHYVDTCDDQWDYENHFDKE